MTKLLQQCFLFFVVVVIPGHNLVNSQVSDNRTIGPTLVISCICLVHMKVFAKFDEIPSMIPQDIKETKHYRRKVGRTVGQTT